MKINKGNAITVTVISAAIASFGVSFDAFWHLTQGRETLYSLPHLFVYAGVALGIYSSWEGFRLFKEKSWIGLFRCLAAIPLIAIIDELWHQWRGVELISDSSIIWSPPHVLLFVSAMSAIMILAVLVSRNEKAKLKNIYGALVMGMFLSMLTILIVPILPFGPFTALGSSGMGVLTAGMVSTYFVARRLFPDFPAATATALVFLALQSIIWDANIYIPSHSNFLHIPMWVMAVMFLAPAWSLDISSAFHEMTRGMVAGIMAGLVLFGLGGYMIPGSAFTYYDLWAGSLMGAIGGMMAGLLDEKANNKIA